MKNKPTKEELTKHPRSSVRFNKELNEYEVRIKFRYKNYLGETKDSSSSWRLSWKDCEADKERILNENRKPLLNGDLTLYGALELCVQDYESLKNHSNNKKYIDSLIKKQEKGKNLTREEKKTLNRIKEGIPEKNKYISPYKALHSLYTGFIPRTKQIDITKIKLKDLIPSHWSLWLKWINSDDEEHTYLSGKSVKRYRYALHKFNNWLFEKGYYSQNNQDGLLNHDSYKAIISATTIKPDKVGERTDRGYPEYKDLINIGKYYKKLGLEEFKNFYFYCVWYVLFFTGMRAGELVSLQWSAIDFEEDDGAGVIHIYDSTNEKDSVIDNTARIKANNHSVKTKDSVRDFTMWSCYRQLLRDYKQSYKYHYQVSNEEMENMFVFPNVTARDEKDRTNYQRHKNLREEIVRVCKALKIEPDYDVQMFRHATASFLFYEKHLTFEECKKYFGHSKDSEMIEKIYLEYQNSKFRKELNKSLKDVIYDNSITFTKEDSLSNRIKKGNVEKIIQKSNFNREWEQIKKAIDKGKKVYYYLPEYQKLIDAYPQHRPDLVGKIKFVKIED